MYCLYTGQVPLFLTEATTWPPRYEAIATATEGDVLGPAIFCDISHHSLRETLWGFQQLSEDLNATGRTERALTYAEYQAVLCCLQYRLLQLQGNMTNVFDECVRLGSLAFLTTVFQLSRGEDRYLFLSKRLKQCCCALEISKPQQKDWMLWLLLTGAISLYGVDVSWLRDRWQANIPTGMTWPEARLRLKKILWIDVMHDKLGKYAFHVLSGNDVAELDVGHVNLWKSNWVVCPFYI